LLRSSTKPQIPVTAIVDSDADPSGIQYPVPANDDSHLHKELIPDATVEADENELKWLKPQVTRNDQC
jgi:ribosomal protein S2